jgi:II/X family phage/plasmid replication protein
LIDWFRGSIPFPHYPLPAGKVLSIEHDGTMDWQVVKKIDVRGSYESNLQIRSSGGDGSGMATHLDIDGNITKFVQGHNLFGTNNLNSILLEAFRKICQFCHHDLDGWSHPEMTEQRIKRGDYLVKSVDINEMYEVGNDESVDAWLHSAEMRAVKRAGRATSRKGTVYLGQHSRRWAIKFYNKYRELEQGGKGHKLPDELSNTPLLDWSKGKLRAELRLLSMELKDQGITHGRDLSVDRVEGVFAHYMGRVEMSKQVTLIDKELMELPRTVAATYQLWRQGANLRTLMTKPSFYRHRAVLKHRGIDINLPPADPDTSNVVPMLRVIEAKPVPIPAWAYEKRLVHF